MFDRLRMMFRIYRMKSPRVEMMKHGDVHIAIHGATVYIEPNRTDKRERPKTRICVAVSEPDAFHLVRNPQGYTQNRRIVRIDIVKLKGPRRQKKEQEQ